MQSPGTLIHEIERPRKIEQCTLNLTFEEEDEFLLEIVGKKYVLLRRLTAIYHLLSPCVVKSTSPETTLVVRILLRGHVRYQLSTLCRPGSGPSTI